MTYSVNKRTPMSGIFANVEDCSQLTRSVVIPFYNEEACVKGVVEEIRAAQPNAEIVAVDDGSKDQTWSILSEIPNIVALRLEENRGQSAAIYAGMTHAMGDVIVLLDGDGQNDPADIDSLIEKLKNADVVVGYRAKRKDTWSRRVASKFANRIRRMFLDDGVRDTGCALKVFPRVYVELIVPFNALHRFLPAVFNRAGLKLDEVPVNHRARVEGTSKYTNWERALKGIYDLFGVAWMLNRKIHFPKIDIKR